MSEEKPTLDYAKPKRRLAWRWIVGGILVGLAVLYGWSFWYVNTHGT